MKGQDLECTVHESETEVQGQKDVTRTWMCKDVPFGVVKSESNGVVVTELTDWGRGK